VIVRITDSSSRNKDKYFRYNSSTDALTLDRQIYQKLQQYNPSMADEALFGYFCDEMQKVQDNTGSEVAEELDTFLGSLGVTTIYPHPDNTYTGTLNG